MVGNKNLDRGLLKIILRFSMGPNEHMLSRYCLIFHWFIIEWSKQKGIHLNLKTFYKILKDLAWKFIISHILWHPIQWFIPFHKHLQFTRDRGYHQIVERIIWLYHIFAPYLLYTLYWFHLLEYSCHKPLENSS